MHDHEASYPDPGPVRFNCPGCQEEVDVPADAVGQLVRCPYCNTDFFSAEQHLHAAVVDDTPEETVDRDSSINRLRIEHYAALRRGAIRSRSWWLVTQIACLFMILDAGGQIFVYVTTWHRWGIGPSLGAVSIVVAAALGVHARRRARDFQREIDTSSLSDPVEPPDFSTLGDGSDFLQQFDKIQ
jgi:hypothetical protein